MRIVPKYWPVEDESEKRQRFMRDATRLIGDAREELLEQDFLILVAHIDQLLNDEG